MVRSKKKPNPGKREGLIKKITRSKEAAERAKAKLEKSYRELQESKDRLVRSEKIAFAGRMAASVAHEIRNPLNMLVMSVQLLQNRLPKKDTNRELVDVTIRNLERIDHLVTKLVDCARPPKLRMGNYDIHKVIDSVIDTIKEKCRTQNIKIVKNLGSKIPKVRIDKEQIEQAVLNIAKNAMEAMPRRGTLAFSTSCDGGHVLIDISDTGRAIQEEEMINIFDPFFSAKKEGIGLGLTICYSVIQAGSNGQKTSKRFVIPGYDPGSSVLTYCNLVP